MTHPATPDTGRFSSKPSHVNSTSGSAPCASKRQSIWPSTAMNRNEPIPSAVIVKKLGPRRSIASRSHNSIESNRHVPTSVCPMSERYRVRFDWGMTRRTFNSRCVGRSLRCSKVLAGPQDADLERLAAFGYRPDVVRENAERRASQETEQALRFDQNREWRKGRTRDVVAARHVVVEPHNMQSGTCGARDRTRSRVARLRRSAKVRRRDAIGGRISKPPYGSTPRRDATVDHERYFRFRCASPTVPYCDVVATDKRCAHMLTATNCSARFGTTIASNPEELLSALTS